MKSACHKVKKKFYYESHRVILWNYTNGKYEIHVLYWRGMKIGCRWGGKVHKKEGLLWKGGCKNMVEKSKEQLRETKKKELAMRWR